MDSSYHIPRSEYRQRDIDKMIAEAVKAEREACISALSDLAKMAKIMGDTSATRALLSAADALSARDQ